MILANLRDIMILQRVSKSLLINFNTKSIQFCWYFSKIFDAMNINILISCQNHPDFTKIRQILHPQKYRNWLISNFGIDIETQFRNSGIRYRNWKPYTPPLYYKVQNMTYNFKVSVAGDLPSDYRKGAPRVSF